jgi:ubiquinol-cytochrome c reductase cytochrome c1 subunit
MTNWIKRLAIKKLLAVPVAAAMAFGGGSALAAGGDFPLDPFPAYKLNEQPSLQNGARLFVNYCLSCHSANLMRYNRLRDIGLTEQQIRDNLLFATDKVGDPMRISMRPNDAKEWFGALPPDLSVIARARSSHAGTGADWLYTFLRAYYRDDSRALGWNNTVFPNVGMPHVLWELQGSRGAIIEEIRSVIDDRTGRVVGATRTLSTYDSLGRRSETVDKLDSRFLHDSTVYRLTPPEGGRLTQAQYDDQVADLVAYITYMSDPSARDRVRLGTWVLMFLGLFTVLAWWLNREYWKDVK